jgi:magnesium transporter
MLLGYPEDTVGAWADPEMLALAPATGAGEALARARADLEAEASNVYVIAEGGRLKGVLALQDLLRAPESTPIGSLMGAPPGILPAAMPLSAARAHPAWQRASMLPVVEQGDRLIGVLHAARLHAALPQDQALRRGGGELTVAGLAAAGYWDAVSGLVQSGLALLPALKRVLPDER